MELMNTLFDKNDRKAIAIDPSYISKSGAQALTLLARADHALAGQDYLAGERTIADVYLYVILRWAHALKLDLSGMSALPGFFERIEADAGVQAALKQQGLL